MFSPAVTKHESEHDKPLTADVWKYKQDERN